MPGNTKKATKTATAKKVETKKVAPGKAAAKPAAKPAARAAASKPKKAIKKTKASTKTVNPSKPKAGKKDDGKTVNELITPREVDMKSIEEYLGIKAKKTKDKPVIPDLYDLIIPPGTPQKLIIKLAKDHNLEIVERDDIYVPVGICDCERELLAIRGDKKTLQKMEKLLLKSLKEFAGE